MHPVLRRVLFASAALAAAAVPGAAPAAPAPDVLRCDPQEFLRLRRGDAVGLHLDSVDAGRSADVPARRGTVRFARQIGARFLVGGVIEGGGGFSIEEGPRGRAGRAFSPADGVAWTIGAGSRGTCVATPQPIGRALCIGRAPGRRSASAAARPAAAPDAVPILSSRPAASAVLYIDFDGAYVEDPGWNGGEPIDATPSTLTSRQMRDAQRRVAADFAAFDIDVTTDPARYDTAPVGSRMRVIVTGNDIALPGTGGAAYIGSFRDAGRFGVPDDVLAWAFVQADANSAAEAISHEFGHTLGLAHDGRDLVGGGREEYYAGHGGGPTGWAPVMGASYTRSVTQWSRGEYLLANNQEDDVAIIAGAENGFGHVPDESGDTTGSAASLGFAGRRIAQRGVITSAADADVFRIDTAGGRLRLRADPATPEPSTDLAVDLLDATGALVRTAAPAATLGASVNTRLAAGTWYVRIRASGRGDPLRSGYTSYGSIGAYRLSGSLK